MKVIRLLLLISIFIGFTGFLLIRYVLFPPNVLEHGRLTSNNVSHSVELSRMDDGRVVIKAETPSDVLFGMGFAHARDQLWQLQLAYLASNASISAFFGDDYIEVDRLLQLITFEDASTHSERQFLQSYADGINQVIELKGKRYPIQFTLSGMSPKKWTAEDVYRYFQITSWLNDSGWNETLAKAIINYYLPDTLVPFFNESVQAPKIDAQHHLTAINLLEQDKKLRDFLNFPNKMASVKLIQAIPEGHQSPVFFASHQSGASRGNLWYPIEIHYGNKQFRGVSTPGLPILFSAFSDQKSWGYVVQEKSFNLKTPQISEITDSTAKLITLMDDSEVLNTVLKSQKGVTNPSFFPFTFELPHNGSHACLRKFMELTFSNEHSNLLNACNVLVSTGSLSSDRNDFINGYRTNYETLSTFVNTSRSLKDNIIYTDALHTDLVYMMSYILHNNEINDNHRLFLIYLSNWNKIYETTSVAASLFEVYLYHLTKASLRPYIEADLFWELDRLGYLPRSFAINLLKSHNDFLKRDGVFSPVSDAFLLRRVDETIQYLEDLLGDDSSKWRWGNLTSHQVTEQLLCSDTSQIHFAGERVCRFTIGGIQSEMSGNIHTIVPMSVEFSSPQIVSSLSTMILFNDFNTTNRGRIYSMTGISGNPISSGYNTLGFSFSAPEVSAEVSTIMITRL